MKRTGNLLFIVSIYQTKFSFIQISSNNSKNWRRRLCCGKGVAKERRVLLKPVTVSTDTGFVRLLDLPHAPSLEDENFPKGWVNFYRIDDYSATAYFYLDKPSGELPALAPVEERTK